MAAVTVMVLEDDDNLRELWRRLLQTAHFEVREAATLNAAFSCMAEADIALMDWYLDGSTADLAVDRWVQLHGDRPLMIVSGRPLENDGLYTRGAWHVFAKPIKTEVLLAVLQRYRYHIDLVRSVGELASQVKKFQRRLWIACAVILVLLGADKFPFLVEVLKGMI